MLTRQLINRPDGKTSNALECRFDWNLMGTEDFTKGEVQKGTGITCWIATAFQGHVDQRKGALGVFPHPPL